MTDDAANIKRLQQRVDTLSAQVADLVAVVTASGAGAGASAAGATPPGQAPGLANAAPMAVIPGGILVQQQQMVAMLDRILKAIENLAPVQPPVNPTS